MVEVVKIPGIDGVFEFYLSFCGPCGPCLLDFRFNSFDLYMIIKVFTLCISLYFMMTENEEK